MDVFKVFCLIYSLLLGYAIQVTVSQDFSPPRIFPEDPEYIIQTNGNLTLRCEGKRPITWTPETYTEEENAEPKYSTITISPSKTPDSEYIYGSILTIQNASYMDTGYFYCHDIDNADFENEAKVSKIYVYVEDPIQLSVLPDYPTGIVVNQHSEAILPCRPTSPNTRVQLYQLTGDEIENVSYDPKIGFRFYASDLFGHFVYTCQFTKTDESGNETVQSLDVLLYVTPITYAIAKPYVEELSGGHTTVGEKLVLKCTLRVDVRFIMTWSTPDRDGIEKKRINISKTMSDSTSSTTANTFYQILTIEETTLADQGEYTCLVKDANHENNNTKFVRIFDNGEHFINLTEENGVYNISVMAGKPNVQWRIDVKAHPLPKLAWYNDKGEEIQAGWSDNKNRQKYEVYTNGSNQAMLKIYDVTINDRGFYYLKAINEFEEKKLPLFLNVTDKPTVDIEMKSFHMINKPSTVICTVAAYPEASVYWYYKDCQDASCEYQYKKAFKQESQNMLLKSYLSITANYSGYVKCYANNSLGNDISVKEYLVTDVANGFGIWGLDEDTIENTTGIVQYPIAINEVVVLYCAASKYNYTDQLQWYIRDVPIQNSDIYTIEKSETQLSYKLTLSIKSTSKEDSGKYICAVTTKESTDNPAAEQFQDEVIIAVREPEAPVIFNSNLNGSEHAINLPEKFEMWCYAKGIPKPSMIWYKNGVELAESIETKERMKMTDGNCRIIFSSSLEADEGSYKCKAVNKVGTDTKDMNLRFKNKPGNMTYYIISFLVVILVLVIPISVWLIFRLRKEQKLRRELKRAGLVNFENGALECLNPDLGVDDQAELLPYDKKWEFPREKLKLGKQLGAGAFGVVMKAEANGIVDGEETTMVAVKMVKRQADPTYIKALASELKIMVHLGKHLNVVNLLGACTKNVAKRELLVIVEYCRFGNLHNYLLRHRNSFIDQIDAKTGKIDYTFGADILERSFSVSSNKSKSQSPIVKYAALSFSRSDNPIPNSMADYRGNFNYSGETAFTGSTAVSMSPTVEGEDSLLTSTNSAQPEWRSNYHGDYKGNVKPICTKDLITWAFQVARGMEYLASRRVLHGDLAARNILLAENNIVKICDFGLAKSMYKSDNYKKKGDGPLPVKWMAVESIRDRVFSTQSDVWSYGIVLWEFFSLARTPYPGMEADERLYNKLVDGYRMDSPQYATKEMYKIMCECWHPKPLCRPSFTKLAETIGSTLEESVKQYYVDLNDPYLVMNTQRLEEGQSDYLAMLSPPDFEHLSSPHTYVNDEIQPNASPNSMDTPGYLCMKSAHIFSPRLDQENVFNFDVEANNKKHNGEAVCGVELLPMLHTQNESDCDTPNPFNQTPATPTSYSNPTYHIPPSIIERTDTDIVKTTDNYVNMPQNKSAIKSDKTVNNNLNNPSTNNYVNSSSRDWERMQV
ncbi:hypothetical protein ILUMI_03160 [Ignelater luminosus]|uniref:receptor protein-tyrosine kinase n=1 Tax=Ignelater luminosus TaxID=2038154 RepID=A0A8K0GMG1_IGNLU|nr:hypothetical protein ILUMI_03160 [Ignelater luminosus]